jgi:hypothetical protein
VAELVAAVDVAAPAAAVWAKLTDWPTHGQWMVLTRVEPTTPETAGVGAGIVGITGLGPATMRDPMVVTSWQPPPADPARCGVEHVGQIVRGSGAFEVEAVDATHSRVIWSEWVRPPFGLLGELGWFVVRPFVAFGLTISLRRLAKLVESNGA